MTHTKNIAAMGYSGLYPENTMLAFKKAIQAGADGVEVDAHLTKDNIIVLCHDDSIDRTTDGKGKIRDFTYEELSRFNAARQFTNPSPSGVIAQLFHSKPRSEEQADEEIGFQAIPRLEDLFELVKSLPFHVIVEMKGSTDLYPLMGERIAELIMQYHMQHKSSVSSFDHYYLHQLSKQYPDIAYAAVTTIDQLYQPEAYLKTVNAKQIHPYSNVVTKEMVQSCHDHGIEVIVWSVGETDEEAGMQEMIEMGVDGLMTHFPNRFSKRNAMK